MSSLRPDFNYRPRDQMGLLFATPPPPESPVTLLTKWNGAVESSKITLTTLQNTMVGEEMQRFMGTCKIYFKTDTNTLNSVSFLEKFGTAFMASVALTFPSLSVEVLNNLREEFSHTVDTLKSSISANNIENKFLIPLTISLLDCTLHHADY